MKHLYKLAPVVLRRLPPSLTDSARSGFYKLLSTSAKRKVLERHFDSGAQFFERSGSKLYHELAQRLARELRSNSTLSDCLVSSWSNNQHSRNYSLRLLRHVHERVLAGRFSQLAHFYPSVGGCWEADAGAQEFVAAVLEHRGDICQELLPVQTNEVLRCRILLLGFLLVHRLTGLRIEAMELGASAGLLLNWDKYCYLVGGGFWGDAAALVRLEAPYVGDLCDVDAQGLVVAKSGCDLRPMNPASQSTTLELRANVWPDQLDRLKILEEALEIARKNPVRIDKCDCITWLKRRTNSPWSGVSRVIYHSHLTQYLSHRANQQLSTAISEMAEYGASENAPLAWMRLEPDGRGLVELRLTLWPGPTEYLLGRADTHARDFRRLV